MNLRRITYPGLGILLAAVAFSACQPARNFNTYFNLFYNMERIMDEIEENVLYMREQKTAEPVFFIPFDELDKKGTRYYPHLERRSMSNEEMRDPTNKIKLDSILIKGSKLMANKGKSDYVDAAVFYIGKAYFYQREWYQSQKKCEELITAFPESKYYPDAHLVLAMDFMQQGKVSEAERMLSRTIDIAWGRKRQDVLTEAFRLNADLQIGEGNVAEALKPYERAMLLSSDDEERARWRYERGLIYFRQGDFVKALEEFAAVDDLSPDVLTQFQTGMQRAAAYRALGQFEEGGKELARLRRNDNFEPWYGLVELETMNLAAARPGGEALSDTALSEIEALSPGKSYGAYALYERGVRSFRGGDYATALANFTKAQASDAPFQGRAARYSYLLNRYFDQTKQATNLTLNSTPETLSDTLRGRVADAFYTTARVFASFDKPDSMMHYYSLSEQWAPRGSMQGARVLYARSVIAREEGRTAAYDTLMKNIADNYPMTEYAHEARRHLNYTEAMIIDPAQDLYKSGRSFMGIGDNQHALAQFQHLIAEYPQSPYAPQAYYAAGLLYEQRFEQSDSAYAYYNRILDLYPASDQAVAVRPLINGYVRKKAAPQTAPQGVDSNGAGRGFFDPNSVNTPPPLKSPPGKDGLVPLGTPDSSRTQPPVVGPRGSSMTPGSPTLPTNDANNSPKTPATGGSGKKESDGAGTTGGKPKSPPVKPPKK